ncbi:MAG: response regulator transcription factor [Alphaproteobacteria bacterium]|nr:response regulator transcription factor [Alphaproteobacteria bacterium]
MRVILADDHDLVRESLKAYIERLAPDIAISAGRDMQEALGLIEQNPPPDVIVLDLNMPGMNGLEGLRRARAMRPQTPVVIMSGNNDPSVVRQTLAQGARGFFPKTMNGRVLVNALRLVVAGETFIPSAALGEGGAAGDGAGRDAGGPAFTRREHEVLGHLLRGRSNKEIALSLGIEEVTIKLHVRGVCRKLGARNRTEAVAIAHQRGINAPLT